MSKVFLKELACIFLLCCVPLLWFNGDVVVMGHDSGFRFDTVRHIRETFYSWQPGINTGTDWTIFKGLMMIHVPEAILTFIFGSLEWAQPFVFIFWMFVMAGGMYLLLWFIFPDRKQWVVRLIGSTLYVYNFFILQAWFIAERAKFSLYAALPLIILILILMNAKRLSILKGSILFGLVYLFFNGGGSPPLYGSHLVLWAFSFLFFSLKAYLRKGFSGIFRIILIYLLCFLFFAGFNSYWILPVIGLFRSSYSQSVSVEGGIEGLIAWEREVSKQTSLLNLIRLQGIADWYDNPIHAFSSKYLTYPLLIFGSFVPFLIIFVAFSKRKLLPENSEARFLIVFCFLLLLITLPLAAGSHEPFGSVYLFLMRHVPGFAIFRSSYYKFAPLVFFSVSILISYSIFQILYSSKNTRKILLGGIVSILFILGYHFPFFSPSFFNFLPQFTTRLTVPQYVKTIGKYLDQNVPMPGRVLLLPPLDDGFINRPIDTYMWGYYSLDLLPRIVSEQRILANDSPLPIVNYLYSAVKDNRYDDFIRLSKVLNVTHILFRHDILQTEKNKTMYTPEVVYKFIQTSIGNPVVVEGEWEVFKLPEYTVSDINITDQSVLVDGNAAIPIVTSDVSVVENIYETNLKHNALVFEAECFWCAEDEYSKFIDSIVLPAQESWIKKRINFVRKKPIDTSIDGVISNSFRELSEKSPASLIQALISLEDGYKKVMTLSGRSKAYFASRFNAFVTKEAEIIAQYFPQEKEKLEQIEHIKRGLMNELWISDDKILRFGVTLPQTGIYTISSYPENSSSYKINDQEVNHGKDIELSKGFHRIEITRQTKRPPLLVLSLKNIMLEDPTKRIPTVNILSQSKTSYTIDIKGEDNPSLLFLNQSFDPRWKLYKSGIYQPVYEESHEKVNGYGNGWILPQGESGIFTIEYMPQKSVYIGFLVSGISLFVAFVIFFKRRSE